MSDPAPSDQGQDQAAPAPWSFWVLVAAATFYVGVRIVQMIGWLFD